MAWLRASLKPMLSGDDTVAAVLRRYREMTQQHRQTAGDLQREVAQAEQQMQRLAARVADPALDSLPDARQAIYEQMAQAKQARDTAQAAVGEALGDAHDDADQLADVVRDLLAGIRTSLDSAEPSALKRMVEQVVGQINFREAGDELVVVREAPERVSSRKGGVAGTRNYPLRSVAQNMLFEYFYASNAVSTVSVAS